MWYNTNVETKDGLGDRTNGCRLPDFFYEVWNDGRGFGFILIAYDNHLIQALFFIPVFYLTFPENMVY